MLRMFQRSETLEEVKEKERIIIKMQRIKSAHQQEKYRHPNPQKGEVFPEENFVEFNVRSGDKQLKLHTYRYKPQEGVATKALIFLFHGMLSHINSGAHVAKQFAEIGCVVVGFDHRGHGKSEGIFGYLPSVEIHLSDSNEFIDKVTKLYEQQGQPNLQIFLVGFSLGGMTSMRLAIQQPLRFKGIILFAPAIKTHTPYVLFRFINVMAFVLIILYQKFSPQFYFNKKAGQEPSSTKNPKVEEDDIADPYSYSKNASMGTIRTILHAMHESNTMIKEFSSPWILIQGGLDKAVDPDIIFDLQKFSTSTDKTTLYYEDCWHDIWHEQEIHDALPKVVQWIQDRY